MIIALGVCAFALYRARQTLEWWTVEPALRDDNVGPYRVLVPGALPASWSFTKNGDAERRHGQLGYDPLDVSVLVMPLGVEVPADEASSRLDELLVGFPGGAKLDTSGESPRIVYDKDLEDAGWLHMRAMLHGASVARVDVRVHPDAPDRWRTAALNIADSLRITGPAGARELAAALLEAARAPCRAGDLDACAFAAERARELDKPAAGVTLLSAATDAAPPMEGLWANAAAALGALPAEELARGGVTSAMRDAKTLEQVVRLHLLLGELQAASGDAAAAFATYRGCWRYDTSLGCALGLADTAAAAGAESDELLALGQAIDERYGERPRGLLVAARLASLGGDLEQAKVRVARLLSREPEPALHRAAVSVRLADARLDPIACPAGTQEREREGAGLHELFCERPDGTRHGPARMFDGQGHPMSEVTFDGGEPGPPERFWWENGMLQKETWVGDDGTIRARAYDPLGRQTEHARRDDEAKPELPPELPKKLPPLQELKLGVE